MDLEQRAIEIRPRSAWEACDLGILMGRRWWWPMVKIWLALAAPWVLVSWLVPSEYALVPGFLYWLGKPLWERCLLYFLSQAIFSAPLPLRQILKQAPRLMAKDWLGTILWRRLSPWRAYYCALTMLEGQTGRGRRLRCQHLAGDNAGTAAKVALLLAHMEGFVMISLFVLAYALTPRQFAWDLETLGALLDTRVFAAGYNTLYILVSALIAPFFVATGFALYLNRRVWLEAWDIDISFRTIAQRLQPAMLLWGLSACLWAALITQPSPAFAAAQGIETSPNGGTPISQALERLANPQWLFNELAPKGNLQANYPDEQAAVLAVLEGDDFHQRSQQLVHHWRWSWQRETTAPTKSGFWGAFIPIAARVLEVSLWVVALVLIIWLALNYRRLAAGFSNEAFSSRPRQNPQVAFGLDLRPTSLPADPALAALNLCEAGDYRQCLALLYRATLVALIERGLDLKASHTEEDCLALARGALKLTTGALDYLQRLTQQWQRLAYGHQTPDPALTRQLCCTWAEIWAQPGAAHA